MPQRLYLLAGLILAIVGFSSSPAFAQSGRTFYIDYANGSNSNNGTSKATPWKTHPYMQTNSACTGTGRAPAYTHQAGDHFVFKGGDTWPAACFDMVIQAGGTSSAQDYYGVDKTWYIGSSWTRPKFDLNYQVPTGNYVIYANSGTGYETFDNLEIEHQNIPVGSLSYPQGCGIQLINGYQGTIVKNSYIHDWMTTNNMTSGSAPTCAGGVQDAALFQNNVVSDANGYAYLSGTKTNEPWGGGCINCGEVAGNVFHDGWVGCFTAWSSCHDNEIYHMQQNDLANADGDHSQCIEDDSRFTPQVVYNNYVHDNPTVGVTIDVDYGSQVYNNVLVNDANYYIIMYIPNKDSSSDAGHVYNNTIDCSNNNACIKTVAGIAGSITIRNNIEIANSPNDSIGSGVVSDHNYTMPTSEANTYGFTQSHLYKPSSTDSNVSNTGLNLTSSCSGNLSALCQDASGAAWFGSSYVTRPAGSTAWNLGAFASGARSAAQPNAPTALVASVQ